MKQFTVLLLLIASLSLLLVGCGGKEPEERHFKDPSEQTTVADTQGDTTTAETAGEIDKELPRIPIEE